MWIPQNVRTGAELRGSLHYIQKLLSLPLVSSLHSIPWRSLLGTILKFSTRLHWPIQPPTRWVFLGMKRPGRGVKNPTSYSSEVKEVVELYLYFYSGCSWPVTRRILPLITTHLNLIFPMVPVLQISQSVYFVLCVVPMRATVPPHFNLSSNDTKDYLMCIMYDPRIS